MITVFLDGVPYTLLTGSRVRELLLLANPALSTAVETGAARLADRFGNEVGSDGDLIDGQTLFSLRSP